MNLCLGPHSAEHCARLAKSAFLHQRAFPTHLESTPTRPPRASEFRGGPRASTSRSRSNARSQRAGEGGEPLTPRRTSAPLPRTACHRRFRARRRAAWLRDPRVPSPAPPPGRARRTCLGIALPSRRARSSSDRTRRLAPPTKRTATDTRVRARIAVRVGSHAGNLSEKRRRRRQRDARRCPTASRIRPRSTMSCPIGG